MTTADLIIIGAGPGGYRAAEYAARQGLRVIIFEAADVGGTCLNVGCIPTKTYVHAATFDEARRRMPQVVAQLRQGVEQVLSHPNITLVRGRAAFASPSEVTVSLQQEGLVSPSEATIPLLQEGAGEVSYSAPAIIIATGSETKWLPIEGVRTDPRVVDSTGLLRLDALPRRLAIIGAGVIGMEFASVFSRFGSEVTVIEYLRECLPALDGDIAKRLRKLLEKRGITFRMKTAVQSLADIDADVILMATGRKPRTERLNLAAAGITLAPDGSIPVDDNLKIVNNKSSNSKLFAIGDCNGRQMLAHAAETQAVRAVNQIVNSKSPDGIRFDIMPAAIFTEPEAACVGPTEVQLKALATPYVCHKAFWRVNGKALAMGETEGMLKLFAAPDDGLILGCHAYGAHAADIVQEISVLMCKHTTLSELSDMVHIHPTLSEILSSAARAW